MDYSSMAVLAQTAGAGRAWRETRLAERASALMRSDQHPSLLVQRGKVVGGPVAVADVQSMLQGRGDELLGLSYCFRDVLPLRQSGGDGRGKRATGAVGVPGLYAWCREQGEPLAVEEDVY